MDGDMNNSLVGGDISYIMTSDILLGMRLAKKKKLSTDRKHEDIVQTFDEALRWLEVDCLCDMRNYRKSQVERRSPMSRSVFHKLLEKVRGQKIFLCRKRAISNKLFTHRSNLYPHCGWLPVLFPMMC